MYVTNVAMMILICQDHTNSHMYGCTVSLAIIAYFLSCSLHTIMIATFDFDCQVTLEYVLV